MSRFLLLSLVFISCTNAPTKTKTAVDSTDTVSAQPDSNSFFKPTKTGHKGVSGFLSGSFTDTSRVMDIQDYVSHIDALKLTDTLELENEEFMKEEEIDGGGSLTGYFQEGKMVKIHEWYGLSWGVLQVSYYLNNNQLVFVRETEDHFYADTSGTDPSRFDLRFRGEYYFRNNALFDEVSLGHNRFENEENDAGKEYPKRFVENMKILLSHRKK